MIAQDGLVRNSVGIDVDSKSANTRKKFGARVQGHDAGGLIMGRKATREVRGFRLSLVMSDEGSASSSPRNAQGQLT